MQIRNFEDLDCWKVCREVQCEVSQLIKRLPKAEKYALAENMKRAARSTTRNIAEGFGRHHHQENLQFCRISRGSLYELLDDLITVLAEGYILADEYKRIRKSIERAILILNGYIRYLEKAKRTRA